MTKKKTKKMTKSTFAIIIMGIALVALLAFGGTFAYFTSTSSARVSKFTTAVVNLRTNGGSNINFAANKVESRETISDKGIQLVNHSNVKTIVAVEFQITYNGKYYESRAVRHDGSDGLDYYKATDDELLLMNLYGLTLAEAHAQEYMWNVDVLHTTEEIDPDDPDDAKNMAYIPGKEEGITSNRLAAHEVTEAFFSYNINNTEDNDGNKVVNEADRWTGLTTGTGTADVGLNITDAPYDNVTSKEDTVDYKWVQGTGIYSNIYLLNTKGTHGQQTDGDYGFVVPESRPSEKYTQKVDDPASGDDPTHNVVGGGKDWVSDGKSKYDFFPNDQNVTFKIDRNFAEYWVDSTNNGSQEETITGTGASEDLNGNGILDFTDTNDNGRYEPKIDTSAEDANQNGILDFGSEVEAYRYAYMTDAANKLPTKAFERFLLWGDADVIFSVRAYQIQVEHVHTFGEMATTGIDASMLTNGKVDAYKIAAEEENVGIVWEAIVNLVGGNDPTTDAYGDWGADTNQTQPPVTP